MNLKQTDKQKKKSRPLWK